MTPSPIHVVVVDDEEEVARLVESRLTIEGEGGFSVTTVCNGFDVLFNPLFWDNVDCLLLDLWLTPRGLHEDFPLAHAIYKFAIRTRPQLAVVLFSAVVGLIGSPELEGQADEVLSKPDIGKLTEIIHRVVMLKQLRDKPPNV